MNIRNRVVPGVYGVTGAQVPTGETAYCDAENVGALSRDNDGECADAEEDGSNVEFAGLTVILGASKTVSIGTMHSVAPTFLSVHGVSSS